MAARSATADQKTNAKKAKYRNSNGSHCEAPEAKEMFEFFNHDSLRLDSCLRVCFDRQVPNVHSKVLAARPRTGRKSVHPLPRE